MNTNEKWLFTFGHGHEHPNKYVRLRGDLEGAREQMFRLFGSAWAFQYPAHKQHELEVRGLTEYKPVNGI